MALVVIAMLTAPGWGQERTVSSCRIHPATYQGWSGQEISNPRMQLIFVPQRGGRLMQASFEGHPFLFVNPKYKGQYISPQQAKGTWINYGGGKLWPLPEGRGGDRHWAGPVSDLLDDGDYRFKIVSRGRTCTVRLEGPADPATGLQYSREVSLSSDNDEIVFHATMRNASDHAIRWSVQSVTQYDTSERRNPSEYNREFWAYAATNASSAYFGGYQVRAGLADDPSFAVKDGIFSLHWLYLENEVWLDSTAGWAAVVDGATGFGMMEKATYESGAEYPGKASIIFYKNGAALELDPNGRPVMRAANPADTPYYMEAELNSPMVFLKSGETYSFDSRWIPFRLPQGEPMSVSGAGVTVRPLMASATPDGVHISGGLGVFTSTQLVARFYDEQGGERQSAVIGSASPATAVELNQNIKASGRWSRVVIHVVDPQSRVDYGVLGEAKIVSTGAVR